MGFYTLKVSGGDLINTEGHWVSRNENNSALTE